MGERDENAYIRFFALWFAAGMAIGVLLLIAASRTGMKEGNTIRLFQAEAFLGRKISAKACFSYLLKVRLAPAFAGLLFGLTAIGAYFAAAAVLAYGFLCGVFLAAAYLQNGIAGLLLFFLALFPQIFLYLAALFLMAAACSQMAETNHLAGGMQKKEYFRFGVRYFFALILLLWGILLESYVNPWFLSKIL
ncbi:stage II sporulation protein M [Fusicatenibacter sp.]